MADKLPPMPNNPITDTFVWRDWFYKVSQILVQQASIAWSSIDFTGSNLRDIQVRQHNSLQNMDGGGTYHLSASQYASLSVLPSLPYKYGAFHFDFSTTLNGALSSGATTINVVSTSGFSSSGAILVESEVITYTGTTSTSFTGCTRGAYGSTSASHASGAYVNGAQGTAANTATLLQLNTTDLSNGVTLNTANSEVTVSADGIYNLQFSVQTFNFDNSPDNFTIWFRKNGIDVPASASIQTTPAIHAGIQGSAIVTVNLFLTLAAGDYVQLYWTTDGGKTVVVTANPGTSPTHPASPAVIFTVNQLA